MHINAARGPLRALSRFEARAFCAGEAFREEVRAEGGAERYWWEAWDCMIAICAMTNGVSVATRIIAEFE